MINPITKQLEEKDNCIELDLKVLIVLRDLKYGDMILNMALINMLKLIDQSNQDLLNTIESDVEEMKRSGIKPFCEDYIYQEVHNGALNQVLQLLKDKLKKG